MRKDGKKDLVVIGAGPGGYPAAFHAADRGMRVTLIDPRANPGGVCLYEGCIPSKALLRVAAFLHEAEQAAEWGVSLGNPQVDLAKLRAWKQSVVDGLTRGLGRLVKQRGIDYMNGTARFLDAHRVRVQTETGDTREVAFEHAIVATGSRPAPLPVAPESDRVLTAQQALDLKNLPPRLLVVGGGYTGLELGQVYAALGSRVSVVEMTPDLLPGADRDLVAVLARRLRKTFERVMTVTRVRAMRETGEGMHVAFDGEHTGDDTFDGVILTIGRKPFTGGLGLENTAVRLTEKGFIEVDGRRRTADASIFAVGDVAGEPMLAHKATHEARVAVEAIAGKKTTWDPRAIPGVVFTDPEIAWCGLTQAEAERQGRKIKITTFPWAASGRATTLSRTDGLTKLLGEPESGRLLGVGLAGHGAGELLAEAVLAIEMGAVADDLALTIHPHPTLSETLMEAAEAFSGAATHFKARERPAAPARPA